PSPAGKSQQALARWIQALGGQVRIAEGRIQAASLVRVPFTDGQLKHLAALHGLEKLNLEATDLSDAGLESLAKLTGLRGLRLTCAVSTSATRACPRLSPSRVYAS